MKKKLRPEYYRWKKNESNILYIVDVKKKLIARNLVKDNIT